MGNNVQGKRRRGSLVDAESELELKSKLSPLARAIKKALDAIRKQSKETVSDSAIVAKFTLEGLQSKRKPSPFRVRAFNPVLFRKMRLREGVESKIWDSLSNSKEFIDPELDHATGTCSFTTADKVFTVKTLKPGVSESIQEVLPYYFQYTTDNPKSTLSRILCLLDIESKSSSMVDHIMIIKSPCVASERIFRLQLPTSSGNEATKLDRLEVAKHRRMLPLERKRVMRLQTQIYADIDFLAEQGVLNYCLVIGFANVDKRTVSDIWNKLDTPGIAEGTRLRRSSGDRISTAAPRVSLASDTSNMSKPHELKKDLSVDCKPSPRRMHTKGRIWRELFLSPRNKIVKMHEGRPDAVTDSPKTGEEKTTETPFTAITANMALPSPPHQSHIRTPVEGTTPMSSAIVHARRSIIFESRPPIHTPMQTLSQIDTNIETKVSKTKGLELLSPPSEAGRMSSFQFPDSKITPPNKQKKGTKEISETHLRVSPRKLLKGSITSSSTGSSLLVQRSHSSNVSLPSLPSSQETKVTTSVSSMRAAKSSRTSIAPLEELIEEYHTESPDSLTQVTDDIHLPKKKEQTKRKDLKKDFMETVKRIEITPTEEKKFEKSPTVPLILTAQPPSRRIRPLTLRSASPKASLSSVLTPGPSMRMAVLDVGREDRDEDSIAVSNKLKSPKLGRVGYGGATKWKKGDLEKRNRMKEFRLRRLNRMGSDEFRAKLCVEIGDIFAILQPRKKSPKNMSAKALLYRKKAKTSVSNLNSEESQLYAEKFKKFVKSLLTEELPSEVSNF
mmetsp:Transcript_17991/g.26964  ORF Transcript_17991/g.26964 Transcript_17991/m.26964 type:complete len:786 (+) Transcript_17991:73-2430(+)